MPEVTDPQQSASAPDPGTVPGAVLSVNGQTGNVILTMAELGSFVQQFQVPATTVTVNHNLGIFPVVTVIDTAGDTLVGDVVYLSNNSLTVTFAYPSTGTVYCN